MAISKDDASAIDSIVQTVEQRALELERAKNAYNHAKNQLDKLLSQLQQVPKP